MSTKGIVIVVAALLLGALGWAFARVPNGMSSANATTPTSLAGQTVPGFRSDAWFLPNDELLGFVEVPEGLFLMGSDPGHPLSFDNEHWADGTGPASVHLPTYYIGRYEVTVAQFRAFVDATEYRANEEALRGAGLDHPVASVSWTDALAYARWLEAQLKASPNTPPQLAQLLGDGWRLTLPSEAQWEKAARGTDGRLFPWGDDLRRDRANFQNNGTRKVGSYDCPECAYGLADMSGNVYEWTRTPFTAGPHNPSRTKVDLESDALWVMKGGSFGDPDRNIRAALRGGADPGVRRPFIGFRLVLTPAG